MADEANHKLTTQIITEFGDSAQNIDEFANKIADLNGAYGTLDTVASVALLKLNGFESTLADKLDKTIQSIREGAIKVQGADIGKTVATALADAISARGIDLDLGGKDEALVVGLDGKVKTALRKQLRKYLNEFATKVHIPTNLDNLTVRIGRDQLDALQRRFTDQLAEQIDKNVKFVPEESDQPLLQEFTIDSRHINAVIGKAKEEFEKLLKSPKFVNIDTSNMSKLTISSSQLETALERIQQSIGNVDEHLGDVNIAAMLKKMPNVGDKLMEFRARIEEISYRLFTVMEGINQLTVKDDRKQYEELAKELGSIQKNLIAGVRRLLRQIVNVIDEKAVDPSQFNPTIAALGGITDEIHSFLNKAVQDAYVEIKRAMNIQSKMINGKEFAVPSIRLLQEQVERAAREALQNLDVMDIGIDTAQTRELFAAWSKQTSSKLDEAFAVELLPLQTDLLSANQAVMKKFVDSVMSLTKISLSPDDLSKMSEIDVEFSTDAIRKKVESKMKEVAKLLVGNISFTDAGERKLDEGVKLPATIATELNKQVRDLLLMQTNRLAEHVTGREGLKFTQGDLQEFDQALFSESAGMINTMLEQARSITKMLSAGTASQDFRRLSEEEQIKVKESIDEAASTMVKNFSEMMQVALGSFIIAGDTAEQVKKKISGSLAELIKHSDITFDENNKPIQLNSVLSLAQRQLTSAMRDNIQSWEPTIDYNPSKMLFKDLIKSIEGMINSLIRQAMAELNQFAAEKVAVKQPVKPEAVAPDEPMQPFKVNKRWLSPEVRKQMAADEEMKVGEWQKADPTTDMSSVMKANVAVIMQAFHKVLLDRTGDATKLYIDEISQIQTDPNLGAATFLALKLADMQKAIQKKMEEVVSGDFDAFLNAIKGMKIDPNTSMSANLGGASVKGASQQRTAAGSHGEQSVGFDRETEYGMGFPPPSEKVVSGNFRNYGKQTENDNTYINAGYIKASKMLNRYDGKVSGELWQTINDFVNDHYLEGIKEISYQSAGEHKRIAKIRIDQELDMFNEIMRGLLHDERMDETSDVQQLRQQMFERTFGSRANKLENDFEWRLGESGFGRLQTELDELRTKAEMVASMPLFDEEDVRNFREQVRLVNSELANLRADYQPLAQDMSHENQMKKLRFEADRFESRGIVPQEEIDQFRKQLDDVYNGGDLTDSRLRLTGLRDRERGLKDDVSADKRNQSLQVQKESMRLEVDRIGAGGYVGADELAPLYQSIEQAASVGDLGKSRLLLKYMRDLQTELKAIATEAEKADTAIENIDLEREKLHFQASKLEDNKRLPLEDIETLRGMINAADDKSSFARARMNLQYLREMEGKEKRSTQVQTTAAGLSHDVDVLEANNIIDPSAFNSVREAISQVVEPEDFARVRLMIKHLKDLEKTLRSVDKAEQSAESFEIDKQKMQFEADKLARDGILDRGDISLFRDEVNMADNKTALKYAQMTLAYLKDLQKHLTKDGTLSLQKEGLRLEADRLEAGGYLGADEVTPLRQSIDDAMVTGDLGKSRLMLKYLKDLQAELKALSTEAAKADTALENIELEREKLHFQAARLEENKVVPLEDIDTFRGMVDAADDKTSFARARMNLQYLRDTESQIKSEQSAAKRIANRDQTVQDTAERFMYDLDVIEANQVLDPKAFEPIRAAINQIVEPKDFARVRLMIKHLKDLEKTMLNVDKAEQAAESFNLSKEKMQFELAKLERNGIVGQGDIDLLRNDVDLAQSKADLDYAKMTLAYLKDMEQYTKSQQGQNRRDSVLQGQIESLEYAADKLQADLLDPEDLEPMRDALRGVVSPEDLIPIRAMLRDLKDLNTALKTLDAEDRRQAKQDSRLGILKSKFQFETDRLEDGGVLKDTDLAAVRSDIANAATDEDIAKIRMAITALKDLQKERKQNAAREAREQEAERKRGTLLAENNLLKTNNALQVTSIQTTLKQAEALKYQTVEQVRVNNASNTWSARVRDMEGNVRSLTGTIDRATGALFLHSEALSDVAAKAGLVNYGNRGGYAPGNRSIMDNFYQQPNYGDEGNQYNPNGDFTSSVFNTMRYMTAGALMGLPSMAMYAAWEEAKETDFQLERARQNFVIKGDNPGDETTHFADVAEERLAQQKGVGNYSQEDIAAEQEELRNIASGQGAQQMLTQYALRYGVPLSEAAQAFHMASRKAEDPHEAYQVVDAVGRASTIEGINVEAAANGLTAVQNQWDIDGYAAQRVMDMMIMGAQNSTATLEDFIGMQGRAGSIFKNNMVGSTKDEALAMSIAMTGIFKNATNRSGNEAGTFFKAIIPGFYSGTGTEALAEASKTKGYEILNPFNEDGSKKQFAEMFGNFLELSMTLTDKERERLWDKVIPGWHTGSAEGIASFFESFQSDMQESLVAGRKAGVDTNKDGEVSLSESVQNAYNKVASVDQEQIDMMVNGGMDTWDKRIEQVKTLWTSSVYGIIDQFKDEFASVATTLAIFTQAIQENSRGIADAMKFATQVAIGFGIAHISKGAWNKLGETHQANQEKKFGKIDRYLGDEQQALNLTRMAIQNRMGEEGTKLQSIQTRRLETREKLVPLEATQTDLAGRHNALRDKVQTDQAAGINNADDVRELSRLRSEMVATEGQINALKRSLISLEEEEDGVSQATKELQHELAQNEDQIRSLNNRTEMLAKAYDDLGLDSSQLKTKVMELNNEFTSGRMDATTYADSIQDLGRQSGMSDAQTEKLLQSVRKLNDEFYEGTISAERYAKEMQALERAQLTGTAGMLGGGVGGNAGMQTGTGLLTAIAATSMFGGKMFGMRGPLQRMKDFATTKSVKDLFGKGKVMHDNEGYELLDQNGKPIYERDVARAGKEVKPKTGMMGSIGEKLGPLGRVKSLGSLLGRTSLQGLLATGLYQGANLLYDANMYQGMEAETQGIAQSSKLQDLIKKGRAVDNKNEGLGGLFVQGWDRFQWGMGRGVNALSHLMGGSGISWAESQKISEAIKSDKNFDKEMAGTEFSLDNKLNGTAKEIEVESEKRYNEFLIPDDQEDPDGQDDLAELIEGQMEEAKELEKINEQLQKIENKISSALGKNQAEHTIERSKLLLQGVEEDSDLMRSANAEFFNKNIATIDQGLKDIAAQKETMDPESDEYKALEDREWELKAQRADTQVQAQESEQSRYDEIMGDLAEKLARIENEYGIQRNNALIGGAKDDSAALKGLEQGKANDSNNAIAQAQRDLQQYLKDVGSNESERTKIEATMLQLQKDQTENLAAIREQLEKTKSTFNLPTGTKPVSYMDYMMSRGTNKSVTTRAGDVTINLSIGNMTGDQADVNKMTNTLSDAIKKAQQQATNSFNTQVSRGMGSAYPSF